jgi:hypothetical protein
MPEIGDYQFQAPQARQPGSADGRRRYPLVAIACVIAVLVGYYAYRRHAAPAPAPATTATTIVPQRQQPLGDDAARIALPALDDSDALVRERIRLLSSDPLVAAWLGGSGLVRNVAVVIDNISHGMTPSPHLRVLRPGGQFRVITRGNRAFIDPRNYERYSAIVRVAMSIDPGAAARTYQTFKPLLQVAYDELGNQEPVDRALERGLAALLRVPAVGGDVAVEEGGEGIGYEYTDPTLEMLSGAKKQLLRMGADNVRAIQQQLRLFARALGIPAQRLL